MADAVTTTEQGAPPAVTDKPSVAQAFGMMQGEHRATEKIEMQRATAQVYAAHMRAIQYPRNERLCIERIYACCENVHFAAGAMYRVPRGGGKVEGLNIQAAKEFARIWGNIEYGTVNHGDYGNMSQFEAYAHDLETNVPYRSSYTIKHQRYVGGKNVELVDDQSIGEIQKARNSKEVRNAILSQLPDYVKEEAKRLIKNTLHKAVQDVPGAWHSAKTKFEAMGVSPASLLRYINKPGQPIDKLDAADIVEIRFLYDAIKQDKSLLDTEFPERDRSKIPAQAPKEGDQPSTENKATSAKPSAAKPTSATGSKNSANATSSNQQSTPASSSSQASSKNSTTTSSSNPSTESSSKDAAATESSKTSTPASSTETQKPSTQKPSVKPETKPESDSKSTTNTSSKPTPNTKSESNEPPQHSESSEESTHQAASGETFSNEAISNQEQTDFSPETEQSEDEQPASEEENQSPSDSEDESTQEQEDDSEDLDDQLTDEDAF